MSNDIVVVYDEPDFTVVHGVPTETITVIGGGSPGPPGLPAAEVYLFSKGGDMLPYTGTFRAYLQGNYTYDSVSAGLGTAPVGASVVVDIKKNGTSIFSTLPAIPTGEHQSDPAVVSDEEFSANDYLTVDIISAGTVFPGADLTVILRLLHVG